MQGARHSREREQNRVIVAGDAFSALLVPAEELTRQRRIAPPGAGASRLHRVAFELGSFTPTGMSLIGAVPSLLTSPE